MKTPADGASLTVVACTYSPARLPQLLNMVAALKVQSEASPQIVIVVDHNSELLAQLNDQVTGVTIIPNVQARGLSGSRNSGIAVATGDIVAFIDDDAEPAPHWLERLSAAYTRKEVIGVGGPVDPMWEVPAPAWFPAEFGWVVGCGYSGLPGQPAPVRNFIGCNMSFRREVLAGTRGFLIELGRIGLSPVGCEETEFCIRLIRDRPADVLWFDPMIRVRHFVQRSRLTWSYFRARCYAEGKSKARVTRTVGSGLALASERSYVVRTLTAGVVRNLTEVLRGDWAGAARATVIVAGLVATVAGYTVGLLELKWAGESRTGPLPEAVKPS